jgi:hypothetical protein
VSKSWQAQTFRPWLWQLHLSYRFTVCKIHLLSRTFKPGAFFLQFIRAEGFIFSHIADEGMLDACAGQLMRYRKLLGSENNVLVFTDLKVANIEESMTNQADSRLQKLTVLEEA